MLGFVYGRHGQVKRGVAYLLIAVQLDPDNVGILRTLLHLLILDGEAEKALATVTRLEALEGNDHPALLLLKSRALLAAGQEPEARESFREFVERRAGA